GADNEWYIYIIFKKAASDTNLEMKYSLINIFIQATAKIGRNLFWSVAFLVMKIGLPKIDLLNGYGKAV
ncbi:hypothetical protein, partial [Muricomes intestini]|uniref:hypothetical protein n=1 Tax=Muricomes intestini TaxID=1796634 RepID=UPI002FDDADF2